MKPDIKKYCRDQMAAYREQSSGDEVSHLLRRCEHFRRWESQHKIGGLAIHHIFGERSKPECNAFCCLIMVPTAAHEFGHQKGGLPYNVSLAFEACCLLGKWELLHRLDSRSFDGTHPKDRLHWHFSLLDKARSVCMSHKTLASRVEYLDESLRGSVFEDIGRKLREISDE